MHAPPIQASSSLPTAELTADRYARLESGREGLSDEEAAGRLVQHGANQFGSNRVTAWSVLARQLRNPLLALLLVAALLSAFVGQYSDAVVIALIASASVGLGFVDEYRTERSVASLRQRISHTATVLRSGRVLRVPVAELVPGDVVMLGVGTVVPADVVLVEGHEIELDESVITGESLPVIKGATMLGPPTSTSTVADRSPEQAWMGTVVRRGEARAVVVATGAATMLGRIAQQLDVAPEASGFMIGLRRFSRFLASVGLALAGAVFVINLLLHRGVLEAATFSLAIAIGITPQLLPAIVTMSLATGSKRLADQNVLVKRLVSIEDLGNVDVLYTDKTGTLTEGKIGFDRCVATSETGSDDLLLLGLVCGDGTHTSTIDEALWRSAAPALQAAATTRSIVDHLPFDYERRRESVIMQLAAGPLLVCKGAPESVFACASSIPAEMAAALDAAFAAGARVIAVARKMIPAGAALRVEDETGLEIVGLLLFRDPPKADAGPALAALSALGVEVKILSGDSPVVARKVCEDLGLSVLGALNGDEIDTLDDAALTARLPTTTVFGRVSPEQKSRVVRLQRSLGDDVAYLGDGVNDALALHDADVGISVEGAVDVAKDAADVVLLDKSLAVVAIAITEGRRIFANTIKYVLMSISSNFGNMASAAGASLFLPFLPMLPKQILLNNLLYDSGQLAIPTDQVDPERLRRPDHWDLAFIRRFMMLFGSISSLFDVMTFVVLLRLLHVSHAGFQTGWFLESLATQSLVVFVIRTRRSPFFRSRPSNTLLVTIAATLTVAVAVPFTPAARWFGFIHPSVRESAVLVALVIGYLGLVEGLKPALLRRAASGFGHPLAAARPETHPRSRRLAGFWHPYPRPPRTNVGSVRRRHQRNRRKGGTGGTRQTAAPTTLSSCASQPLSRPSENP